MTAATRDVPDLPGVLSASELVSSADHLARLQLPNGMIPWYPDGHCDPWNHVECAMALDVAGRHADAQRAYGWLVDMQRPSGAWANYYTSSGAVEEPKLDTNVCAYVATGAWHHWLCTGSRDDAEEVWPTVERALTWVLSHRRPGGLVLWAVEADETRTWDYALLTGSASIAHALRCGARLATALGHRRRSWTSAADVIVEHIANRPELFEPKDRWAMDWYYPALTGALGVSAGKARLADGWSTFVMEGLGVRCVNDEPWVTASETAECALAFAAIGDTATASDLLRWTRSHRRDDGSYWTGIVYPQRVEFPFEEHSSYTAAAIILAADAITKTTPASSIFHATDD